jgi:Tat protein secretion system quality control protein TatD with DNase activity
LEGQDPSVAELLALADEDNIIAIGETGLDYFHVEKDTADYCPYCHQKPLNLLCLNDNVNQ